MKIRDLWPSPWAFIGDLLGVTALCLAVWVISIGFFALGPEYWQ